MLVYLLVNSNNCSEVHSSVLEIISYNLTLNGSVTYTSSDTSIAVVENGTVKMIGNGPVIITVTCGNYSTQCFIWPSNRK